jgi:hypothetical protein
MGNVDVMNADEFRSFVNQYGDATNKSLLGKLILIGKI